MEFQPFKAARAAGLRLEESMLQGKGSAKGKGDKGDKGDARDRSRSRDFDWEGKRAALGKKMKGIWHKSQTVKSVKFVNLWGKVCAK